MNPRARLSILFLFLALPACDWQRTRKCEWYLIPDTTHRQLIEPGEVTLCARNYEIGKQKCGLKAKLSEAERWVDKPLKLSELELKEDVYPRPILAFRTCEKGS